MPRGVANDTPPATSTKRRARSRTPSKSATPNKQAVPGEQQQTQKHETYYSVIELLSGAQGTLAVISALLASFSFSGMSLLQGLETGTAFREVMLGLTSFVQL
jgi:hypothetical protein